MTITEVYEKYALNDGRTLTFDLDFTARSCSIKLKARCVAGKKNLIECEIKLMFEKVERRLNSYLCVSDPKIMYGPLLDSPAPSRFLRMSCLNFNSRSVIIKWQVTLKHWRWRGH